MHLKQAQRLTAVNFHLFFQQAENAPALLLMIILNRNTTKISPTLQRKSHKADKLVTLYHALRIGEHNLHANQ